MKAWTLYTLLKMLGGLAKLLVLTGYAPVSSVVLAG